MGALARVMTRHHSTAVLRYGSSVDHGLERISNALAMCIIAVGQTVRNILIEREQVDPRKIIVIRNEREGRTEVPLYVALVVEEHGERGRRSS